MVLIVAAHGVPALGGDPQDQRGDAEPDDRVCDRRPECDRDRAENHSGADDRIAPSMVAVGDQRRAVEASTAAEPHSGGNRVANHTDSAREPEREQVLRGEGVDDAQDREHPRGNGASEDREHYGESGAALGAFGAQQERRGERDGSEGVAGVVD